MTALRLAALLAALLAAFLFWVGPEAEARSAAAPVRWSDIVLLDGRTLPARELNNQVVVVQFWASWCPFCAKQSPYVQRLYEQHGRALRVLTFSIDSKPEDASNYLTQRGYAFPAAMAGAQSARWFPDRTGLPVVYVVDRAGRIVFQQSGEMFEEDIAALARFAGVK